MWITYIGVQNCEPSMKSLLLIALLAISFSQASSKNLLGIVPRDSLMVEPYRTWFQKNYDEYVVDALSLQKVKAKLTADITIDIFFGTWCGDSQREVPRFLKIMDHLGIDGRRIRLIGVDTGDNYKQSPGGETVGRSIYRVGTFILMKSGKELNRITEHPVRTLELDLLDIVNGAGYTPNYKTYALIEQWMQSGLLTHQNTSLRGLAKMIKPLLFSPSELSSCGHVLLTQKKLKEAVAVFRMNATVFYDNPDVYSSLAEGLSADGNAKEAIDNIVYAVSINKEAYRIQGLLDTYHAIKKKHESVSPRAN